MPPDITVQEVSRKLAGLQARYNQTAATTNEAMSGILAACAGLDADTRNNIVRAAIAYAEADHIRRNAAKVTVEYARKHGIR